MKPDRATDFMSDTSLDREIEAVLSVKPSADFVSRVRTNVATTTVPGWTMGWTSLAAGSVVVAVFVAVVISKPYDVIQEAPGPATTNSMRIDAPSDDVPASPNRSPLKRPEPREPEASKATFREPEMLINPDDAAAMRHFLANPQRERVELSLMTVEPQPLPEFTFIPLRGFLANPQPERVELSLMTIETQPLPEYTFTPLPVFNPSAVLQGEFK